VYAVAAETDRQRLRVATRYRGAGPQGFRNYVALLPDALAEKPEFSFKEFALSRRLQPVRTSPTCPVCRVVPAS
jgi:hypothetical protein